MDQQGYLALWHRRRDPRAVESFVLAMDRAARGIARSFARRLRVEAEDLAQEARIHALQRFSEWDPSRGGDLFPWVYQRMVWHVTKVARESAGPARLPKDNWDLGRRPPRAVSLDDPEYLRRTTLDASIQRFEETREIRRALASLPMRDAQILLRKAEGWTFDEIARPLNVSRQAVAKAERKAMRRLKLLMETRS